MYMSYKYKQGVLSVDVLAQPIPLAVTLATLLSGHSSSFLVAIAFLIGIAVFVMGKL